MTDLSKIQKSNDKLSDTVPAFKEAQEEQNTQLETVITGDPASGNSFVP